jgi:hypothetical protein
MDLSDDQLETIYARVAVETGEITRLFDKRNVPPNIAALACYALAEALEMLSRSGDTVDDFKKYQQARDYIKNDLVASAGKDAAVRS